ncbi:MAG: response regulator transcription factor [bacterium]|nr:response regulator transcription factor [bacterium]
MNRNPIQVMIVDDDPRYTEMLEIALAAEGIQATRIQDPREAQKAALARRPDVIVTDVTMPDMDGFALAAGLKADSRTSDIPVIFVSARSDGKHRAAGVARMGADYLAKPFSVPELVQHIRAALRGSLRGVER